MFPFFQKEKNKLIAFLRSRQHIQSNKLRLVEFLGQILKTMVDPYDDTDSQ